MEFSVLKSRDEVLPFLSFVIDSADRYKDELGFLPQTVYQDQAEKGRLWVLIDRERSYAGHLMFGGYKQALKITQMFVVQSYRRSGLATIALDALKEHAKCNGCQYIQARVAADLPANEFWEKNEFIIVEQKKGGETTKRLINARAWFVPNSGLIDNPSADSNRLVPRASVVSKLPSYVLDTNVVIDVSRQRESSGDMEKLLTRSISQELRLRSTPELAQELQKGASAGMDDLAVRMAKLIQPLAVMSDKKLDGYIDALRPIIFPNKKASSDLKTNERSDLVHLAYCIEYQQDAFVTRDGPILQAGNKLGLQYGIEVLTPFDLSPPDSVRYNTIFGDGHTDNVSFSWSSPQTSKETISSSFPRHLVEHIAQICPDWLSRDDNNQRLLSVALGGQHVGSAFIIWNPAESNWEVIVSPLASFPVARNLIDAVLQHIYDLCRAGHCSTIGIILSADSVETYELAIKSGFIACNLPGSTGKVLKLKRPAFKGYLDQHCWLSLVSSIRRTLGWKLTERIPTYEEFVNTGAKIDPQNQSGRATFLKLGAFENLVSPGIVVLKSRPSVLIPIQGHYARQLLPETDQNQDMLAKAYAGMNTERVYFSSSPSKSLATGAIAVFYESNEGGGHGVAVAAARITSVVDTTEREAKKNYVSRGVLKLRDSDDAVRAITFSNILKFDNPVPFQWMKSHAIISGANLVTAQKISIEQLLAILNYRPN